MSSQLNTHENNQDLYRSQGKVKVTDLLSRLNEEKKNEFGFRCSSCIRSRRFWNYINNLIHLTAVIRKSDTLY